MSSNITARLDFDLTGFYIVALFSFLCVAVTILICLIILLIIYLTRALHTPTNLLLCDACVCALLYSLISVINEIYLYTGYLSTDWSCRIRGYLTYVAINLIVSSYTIQAISRFFWTVLYKYRFLLTNRWHTYLILFQLSYSFLMPLSTIITKDIVARPYSSCYVSVNYRIHILYLLSVGYIFPVLVVIILYTIIYRYSIRLRVNVGRAAVNVKRDRELARNILILLSIFLFGGLPTAIYIIVSNRTATTSSLLYLFAASAPTISLAIEKAVTITLNKDIRKAIQQRWLARPTRVQPFHIAGNFPTRTNMT